MKMPPPTTPAPAPTRECAFTMIEIALSLAVIGFALVSVIGILPLGMSVQKDNREETIINQDAAYWMEAIRGGARGLDDLTNYVESISIIRTEYAGTIPGLPITNDYTRTSPFAITNGQCIIGLMTTPKYQPGGVGFFSNYVVAFVQALSGSAAEKFPQTNQSVQELAFKYRLTSEVITYDAPDSPLSGPPPEDIITRSNYWLVARNLQTNLHELRLTFRWPLLPDGSVPLKSPRQSFRVVVGGQITNWVDAGVPLHFLQSRTYRRAQSP